VTWRPSTPGRSEREPQRLGASLDALAVRMGLAPPALLAAIFARWSELVGPDVAAHAQPLSVREGTLVVVVDHPAWAASLRLLSESLLERIREETGVGELAELVVRVQAQGPERGRQSRR
jgi:predicted nucleic acid-binding Zn ribbon protein